MLPSLPDGHRPASREHALDTVGPALRADDAPLRASLGGLPGGASLPDRLPDPVGRAADAQQFLRGQDRGLAPVPVGEAGGGLPAEQCPK